MSTIMTLEQFVAAVPGSADLLNQVEYLHVPASLRLEAIKRLGRIERGEDLSSSLLDEHLLHARITSLASVNCEMQPGARPSDPGFDDVRIGILLEVAFAHERESMPRLVDPNARPVAVAILRVVENFLEDDAYLADVKNSVEADLRNKTNERLFYSPTDLEAYTLENSPVPVIRRLNDLVVNTEKMAIAQARYRLQVALAEIGMGKINGLDVTEFDQLDAESLAKVMVLAVKAYRASMVGALYYMARKGTSRDEFDAWYDQLLSKHNWTRAGVENAFQATRTTNLECTPALIAEFSNDAAAAYVKVLFELDKSSDLSEEQQRQLALDAFGSYEDRTRIFDMLKEQPSRSLEEIFSDGAAAAGPTEIFSALAKAQADGVLPQDENVAAGMLRLPTYLTILSIRQDGVRQMFFFEALRSAKENSASLEA